MLGTDTAAITNALVEQKNRLMLSIQAAEYAEELRRVKDTLDFLSPLWAALGCGYKLDFLRSLVKDRAGRLFEDEQDYLSTLRKNARTRVSTEKHMAALRVLGEF